MNDPIPATALQLRSLVKSSGVLEISLVETPVLEPDDDQVLIRVEATPINPSDQGLLFGAADLGSVAQSGTAARPVITARIPSEAMASMAGRVDQSMIVGNEGCGTVVRAGTSEAAQAMLGKRVAVLAGGMYSQYRIARADQCLVLPDDATAEEGASCFVNPLTALGMVATMHLEGHTALVHTAAASNLGQMLVRICQKDGIGLVNVVRSDAQAELLKSIGATHVCNTSRPTFDAELCEALVATGATIAFDAIGGGRLATQILWCMEQALGRSAKEYSRYGSSTHKQVYLYGALDRGPTVIERNYGMAWGVGGWLLTPFLQRIGAAGAQRLRERVAAELKTTFASRYTAQVTLPEALSLESVGRFSRRATGEKFLILPNGPG